ncbi:hypothetical protein [Ruegeria arenilitoris]|uniref:hypothetical protein n=1 Tax=Ruegeria arenilitoris TaxID=1173585 RepID=UPI00148044C3|nr:hypothetical protein [Ruegeria arenilitoris]
MEHNNKLNIAIEALRQTELQLEDINNLASNADQRAMALAGTLAAMATILATLASRTPSPFLSYVSCGGFIVASFVAASTCMPRRFHIRGHRWEGWKGHVDDNDDFLEVVISQAEENDIRISENFTKLNKAAKVTWHSFTFAFWVFCFFLFSQIGTVAH